MDPFLNTFPPGALVAFAFPPRRKRGSALLATLCLAAVLSLCLGSYVAANYRSLYLSSRDLHYSRSLQLAEMGIEEGYWALVNNSWSGWTIAGSTASKTIDGFIYESGVEGEATITITNYDVPTTNFTGRITPSIRLESVGSVRVGNGIATTRTLEARAEPTPIFSRALSMTSALSLSSTGGVIDSYDAWPLDATTGLRDTLALYSPPDPSHLAPAESAAIVAGSTVDLGGTQVYGYAATQGTALQNLSSARLVGPGTPNGVRIDPLRFSTILTQPPQPAAVDPGGGSYLYDPITGSSTLTSTTSLGAPGGSTPTVYRLDYIDLTHSNVLTIEGPVVIRVRYSVQTLDSAMIRIIGNGSLRLMIDGTNGLGLYLQGNGIRNETYDPQRLTIQAGPVAPGSPEPSSASLLSTPEPFYGAIYLPNDSIGVYSNLTLHGAIVARGLTFYSGATASIHYDASLRRAGFPGFDPHSFVLVSLHEL